MARFGGFVIADKYGHDVSTPEIQAIARCIATVDACSRYLVEGGQAVKRNDLDRLGELTAQLSFNLQEINRCNGMQLRADMGVMAGALGIGLYSHEAPAKGGHDA